MKKLSFKFIGCLAAGFISLTMVVSSCKKDNDDPALPSIGGYNNSDEVGSANLVGYWSFDGNNNEKKSGSAPSASVGVASTAGVKGQGIALTNGYLYYPNAIANLGTRQAFTISAWIQVTNTGQSPTPPSNVPYCYFQSAMPGQLFGNVTCFQNLC
jgi:hypothetical protein